MQWTILVEAVLLSNGFMETQYSCLYMQGDTEYYIRRIVWTKDGEMSTAYYDVNPIVTFDFHESNDDFWADLADLCAEFPPPPES